MTAIVIITYNTPVNLLLLQIEAIKKMYKGDYRIIIFDNSPGQQAQQNIAYQVNIRPEISYRKCKASSQGGSDSHAFAANLSYSLLKDKYEKFLYLDHDCIPIKPFSVPQVLGDRMMGGIGHGEKKTYFWPGCFMFYNTKIEQEMLSFSPSHELGLDTGGGLHTLIEYYGTERCHFFDEQHVQNPNFNKNNYNFYSLINNGMFMHFINASNWNGTSDHEERVNSLVSIAESFLNL